MNSLQTTPEVPETRARIAARVRAFVLENFYVSEPERLGDEDSLLRRGVVDSTGFLEIIAFLEGAFGLAIEDEELVPDHFETIGRIAAFVEQKLGGLARDRLRPPGV